MLDRLRDIFGQIAKLSDLPPLFFRLILAYGFYEPAKNKINNFEDIAQWFDSLGFPFPLLNAYLAGVTELLGFILLFLGLGTRLIAAPLMFVMIVAITTVHWSNGFAASDNGYEIALYYFLMLFSLLVTGPGRISLDHLLKLEK
jgi:putative oxidoreductase